MRGADSLFLQEPTNLVRATGSWSSKRRPRAEGQSSDLLLFAAATTCGFLSRHLDCKAISPLGPFASGSCQQQAGHVRCAPKATELPRRRRNDAMCHCRKWSGAILFIASSVTMSGHYPPQLSGINGFCDARGRSGPRLLAICA
jgi:hypothetical protein